MLPAGRKLGRYEVVAPLGAGGMGEVYRARDAELQRDVAVKILPEALSSDLERVKRFEREAKAAAALAHPNVLTVFDVGRQDGRAYLVFELLDGSTLAEVMKPGALRTREVLEYAAQIARGLAAVHTGGLVHRDLKPANLFLTSAGIVKIIDFGLARVSAMSPTPREETTADVTGPGVALGTVSYMAPEQAQGLVVDARSDIFSLGTVLYEMLSGRHPFRRASAAETVAAILRDDPPDLGRLDGIAVGALKQVVGRCLEKRPEDRFQTANDLALAFEALKQGRESIPDEARSRSPEPEDSQRKVEAGVRAGGRRRSIGLALAVGLIGVAIAWGVRSRELPLPPARLVPLTTTIGYESDPTFSPDGEQVAFEWGGEKSDNTDIYIKQIGSPEVRRLTTDPAPDWVPTWSPDGRQIAFVRALGPGKLTIHVVSPLGGPDRKLTDHRPGLGMSWSPDGRWLATGSAFAAENPASTERGIRLISASGGDVRAATAPSAPSFDIYPAFSPDGRHLAYASCVSRSTCHLDVVELASDARPAGPARRLTPKPIWMHWAPAWTADGKSLVYPAGSTGRLWRVATAAGREPELVELAGYRVASVATARSRDRLVFQRKHGHQSVARFVRGRPSEILAASAFEDRFPDYSPDGRRFAFESSREGDATQIWLAAADGSSPTQLTHGPGLAQGSPRFSPDGRTIAFDSLGEDGHWDVWTIGVDGGPPRRVTTHPGDDNLPSWSRDGRFLYWSSDRAGGHTIWRAPAEGGPEERVTQSEGAYSHEAPDGKTLFFQRSVWGGSPLVAVGIRGGAERTVIECVGFRGFVPHAAGIYHVGCGLPLAHEAPLYLVDPATGRDRLLGTLEKYEFGLAVAPDGKSILYGTVQGEGSDLMLIENFR
jgi:serine/threonine protein kinase/Tol biopolymer transport system component